MLPYLLIQVDPPEPGKEIYWIAALLAGACGVLFWQLLRAKDEQNATCIADKATCTTEKKECTTTLAATVDAQRALATEIRSSSQDLGDWRTASDRRLEAIERNVATLLDRRSRGG